MIVAAIVMRRLKIILKLILSNASALVLSANSGGSFFGDPADLVNNGWVCLRIYFFCRLVHIVSEFNFAFCGVDCGHSRLHSRPIAGDVGFSGVILTILDQIMLVGLSCGL